MLLEIKLEKPRYIVSKDQQKDNEKRFKILTLLVLKVNLNKTMKCIEELALMSSPRYDDFDIFLDILEKGVMEEVLKVKITDGSKNQKRFKILNVLLALAKEEGMLEELKSFSLKHTKDNEAIDVPLGMLEDKAITSLKTKEQTGKFKKAVNTMLN